MSNNQFMDQIEAAVRQMGHLSFKISDLASSDLFSLEYDIRSSKATSVETRIIGAYDGKIVRASEQFDMFPFNKNDIHKLRVQISSCIYAAIVFIVFGILLLKFAWYILPVFAISTLTCLIIGMQVYADLKRLRRMHKLSDKIYVDMPIVVQGVLRTATHQNGTYELCATDTDYIVIQHFHLRNTNRENVLKIIIEKGLQM